MTQGQPVLIRKRFLLQVQVEPAQVKNAPAAVAWPQPQPLDSDSHGKARNLARKTAKSEPPVVISSHATAPLCSSRGKATASTSW